MVKGFEHLSDAQLEHYGTDSFPETSGDAPSIEAHLEDCDLCRSRVLEHQRVRFALLAAASMNASPPTTDCVSEDDLRKLAAGIAPQDQALAITKHVAQCPHCAPILRAFTEDFSDDLTADDTKAENEVLSQLKSSTPKWHKEIAREEFVQTRVEKRSPHIGWASFRLSRSALAVCWAVVLFGIVAVFLYPWLQNQRAQALIASEYAANRPSEYRMPGMPYGPYAPQRGESQKRYVQLPGKSPRLTAAIALLRLDPLFAIKTLENERRSHNQQRALLDDLAVAYASRAEQTSDEQLYIKARDLCTEAISLDPLDSVAYFNRALIYGNLNCSECRKRSEGDLEKSLTLETDPMWIDEIQRRLHRLR